MKKLKSRTSAGMHVPPFRPSLFERVLAVVAERIDRSTGWSKLPTLTGLLVRLVTPSE